MFKKYNNIVNNADSVNCLSGNNYNYNKSKYKNSIVSVNINNNFGYNLIILSVIILMMGALMTATISYYDINNISRRTKNTQDKFKVIHTALISYLAKHGKFPCPAPLDCNSTECNNDNSAYTKKILGNEFRSKQEDSKNCIADNSGVFESTNKDGDKLLYGNVPAISLGLDNSYLVDDWGNKLVYIVPDEITKDDALKDISPLKEYVADGKLFVLLSNGANTSGAFPFESRISNSFNEEIIYNLPKANFEVNISDPNYLKYYKNIDVEISEPDCEEITLTYNINVENNVENEECREYGYTGKQETFEIPKNAKRLKIEVWGAGGGHTIARKGKNYNSKGGKGGHSYGTLEINDENLQTLKITDRTLYLYVGGKGHNSITVADEEYDDDDGKKQPITYGDGLGGWNGGGSGLSYNQVNGYFYEGGGGGATDVRTVGGDWNDSKSLNSRIIVAGGGGGSSGIGAYANYLEERGGKGAGGIGENHFEYKRHKFGGSASGHDESSMPGLGGGRASNNQRGGSAFCRVKGGGTLKGGGGYYAGGSTFCESKKYSDRFRESCELAKSEYSYDNECGGGGGGSSFIHLAFSDAGGESGVRRGHGKIIICVISENNNNNITFPKAKYGELSFPPDFVCPSSITTPTTTIFDYYTLSNFKDKDNLIINNKPAIKCGKNGEWETNEDGSIKMIYKCLELPKCKKPSDEDNKTDWGNFNFEVVNTGQVESVDGTKKMQCIVGKDNKASWHTIQ